MGWASGLESGRRFGRTLIDTYNESELQGELSKIDKDRPQELEGYTGEHGEQLRAMAAARDPATGKPYYNVGFDDKGNYTVTPNFDDPTTGGRQALTLPRGTVTDYLGSRTEGTLSPEQQRRAKGYAYAGVLSARDPVRGLALENSIRQSERDDVRFEREGTRFGWEAAQQPLKQQQLEQATEAGGIQLDQARRSVEVQQLLDETAKMPRDAIELYASRLNLNDSQVPMLYVGKTDKGYQFVSTDPQTGQPTGKRFDMNEAQLREMAAASVLMLRGFGQEGMQKLSGVSKEVADMIGKWNQAIGTGVTTQNQAVQFGKSDEFKDRKLGIEQQEANDRGTYYRGMVGAANARDRAGKWQIVGPSDDGKGMIQFDASTGQSRVTPLPPGVDANKFFKRITGQGGLSPGDRLKAVTELMNTPNPKAGGKRSYTEAEANAVIDSIIGGAGSSIDALKKELRDGDRGQTDTGTPSALPARPSFRAGSREEARGLVNSELAKDRRTPLVDQFGLSPSERAELTAEWKAVAPRINSMSELLRARDRYWSVMTPDEQQSVMRQLR